MKKLVFTTIVLCIFLIGFTASMDESANKTNSMFDIPYDGSAEFVLDNQNFEGTQGIIQGIYRIVLYGSGEFNNDCHVEGVSFWGQWAYNASWYDGGYARFQNKEYKYCVIGTGIPYGGMTSIDLYVAPSGWTWINYGSFLSDQEIANMFNNTSPVGKLRRVK